MVNTDQPPYYYKKAQTISFSHTVIAEPLVNALIDCTIGKIVRPIRQSSYRAVKTGADRRFRRTNYVIRILLHSQQFFSVRCSQTWQFISILCTISTTTPCQRGSLHFNVFSSSILAQSLTQALWPILSVITIILTLVEDQAGQVGFLVVMYAQSPLQELQGLNIPFHRQSKLWPDNLDL